jgi:trigger factor
MYMSNPEIVQQIQPLVLEQQAIDWILENGKTITKKVSFSEFMQ